MKFKLNWLVQSCAVSLALVLAASGLARATTFASYSLDGPDPIVDPPPYTPNYTGTLNGVGFSITFNVDPAFFDFWTEQWGVAPSSSSGPVFDNQAENFNTISYYASETGLPSFTVTFAQAMNNLELWATDLRGATSYAFDRDITLNSGAINYDSISGNTINVASTGTSFQGIVRFDDPVTSFTLTPSGGGSWDGEVGNFAFAAVPEIDPNSMGSVAALVMGVLGWLERRRLTFA